MEIASLELLYEICKKFNEEEVDYVICGAFASILHGVEKISGQIRPTKDFDFLVDDSEKNMDKIKKALSYLTEYAKEIRDNDLKKYVTVQISDDRKGLVIDLISKMWGIDYLKARKNSVMIKLKDIEVPVISIDDLIKMKERSMRPQDKFDVYYLKKLKEQKDGRR